MTSISQRSTSRSAVVTGCSRGIGRAIAKRLAAEGYKVVANDIERQRSDLESPKAEIVADRGLCELAFADVSRSEQVHTLAGEALSLCGTLDVLVNTINAVCPGIIDTEMGRNNYRDESYRKVIEKTALGRLGYPGDVSGSVAFFASDDAAFITGQALNVCGGIIFH